MHTSEFIEVERHGPVQTVRMNRPEKKNAITRDMYAAMAAALRRADAYKDIRCSVIFGVPGAFSAGNDIADFMEYALGGKLGTEVLDFLDALATSTKPIVAGVDGVAVGVGATLHLHTDLTFATERSLFRTPFVDLGLVPEAGSSLLGPARLGRQNAFAMLGLGEGMTSEEAKAAGLVYKIVAEDELERETMAHANLIASKPPEALKIARDLMLGDRHVLKARIAEEAKLFGERLKSDEAKAAFTAFMARK